MEARQKNRTSGASIGREEKRLPREFTLPAFHLMKKPTEKNQVELFILPRQFSSSPTSSLSSLFSVS